MKNLMIKDYKKRFTFFKFEKKRVILKYLISNRNINKKIRFYFWIILSKLPKYSSQTVIKNRCVITGRGRGIISYFRMSRIQFREFASFGFITGLKKKTW